MLGYRNADFLDSDDGRPVRILAEYLEPLQRFRARGIRDTVVFFGSARIAEDGPLGQYYRAAQKLARMLTEWSQQLERPGQFVVCSGGGGGIMEAANRGAAEAGGPTIGLNIGLPHEQRPNPYISEGLSFEFRYFFMRKLWFAHLARALVVFPGGFGTLDELSEILTLTQTGKLERAIPVLMFGASFWRRVIDFDVLRELGLIAVDDARAIRFVDSPEDAFHMLRECLKPEPAPCPSFARTRVSDATP